MPEIVLCAEADELIDRFGWTGWSKDRPKLPTPWYHVHAKAYEQCPCVKCKARNTCETECEAFRAYVR